MKRDEGRLWYLELMGVSGRGSIEQNDEQIFSKGDIKARIPDGISNRVSSPSYSIGHRKCDVLVILNHKIIVGQFLSKMATSKSLLGRYMVQVGTLIATLDRTISNQLHQ